MDATHKRSLQAVTRGTARRILHVLDRMATPLSVPVLAASLPDSRPADVQALLDRLRRVGWIARARQQDVAWVITEAGQSISRNDSPSDSEALTRFASGA